jgi:outer membrane murein-binding lipoprotein Lpp
MYQNHDQHHVVELQSENTTRQHRRSRSVRLVVMVAAVVLTVGLVAGCGDDEDEDSAPTEGTSEEAFCAAGDSLESNVDGLGDIDIIAEGTNALDAQFDAIKSDLEDLRTSGSEVAANETATLEDAVDQLETDLDALGEDMTAEGARAVRDSANDVVTAARAVHDNLEATCP